MLKLPRNKNKIQVDYKSDDLYKFYIKNNPHMEDIVSKATYMEIIKDFMREKFNHMMISNIEYYLPARLGNVTIKSKRIEASLDADGNLDKTKLAVDYNKTLKLWAKIYPNKTLDEIKAVPDRRMVYHLNEHSDGRKVYFFWDKLTSNVRNQSAYRVQFTRTLKRTLAAYIKKYPNKLYHE